jgi:hypothetical protein
LWNGAGDGDAGAARGVDDEIGHASAAEKVEQSPADGAEPHPARLM